MGQAQRPKSAHKPRRILSLVLCFLAISIGASSSHASTTPIPKNADGPLLIWEEKAKYYLVIAVDETGVPGTELPFTVTDGKRVATALDALGYRPLVEEPLIGPIANRNTVNAALKRIRDLPEWATVIVYYSGHGIASPNNKDISLQLAGQTDVDYGVGIKVADLVESAKNNTYLGELHLIIDACFSGTGAFSGALTLKELGAKTTIFTSSATTQQSLPMTLKDGTKLSAFTHSLLEAIDSDWGKADDNGDGILRFGEVKTYSFNQLRKWHQQARIEERMQPQLVGGHHEEVILAYKRDKVERWSSSSREALTLVAVERSLIPTMPTSASNASEKPKVSQEAQLLAQQLRPTSDDPYAQGIKAQAEGRLDDAKALFAQAEALEEESKEKLAKIYLARGRNETYSGNFKDALPWYQKRVALQPTNDPTLLNEFGQAWDRAGNYEDALPFYANALSIREKTLNPTDPDLAISLNNLAGLYQAQGKYADAEPLYQRVIKIFEAALGTDHPNVATAINNLAELFRAQGKYAEAEPLYQRALAINEQAWGPEHPQVAQNLNNLAGLYQAQGKYADAEPLYQRVIKIFEAALGTDHPNVATVINNLAELFRAQGKYADADPLYQRVIKIFEAAQGTDHPNVATAINNLALLYKTQGKYAEAEPLYQRALRISETALGPEHPSVAIHLNNLAGLYQAQGKYADAEPLYQRVIKIFEAALGTDHPNVATAINNLAALYDSQGKYAEAEPLYQRALAINEQALGSEHPQVALNLNNLAALYDSQGKYADAEPLYQRALAINEQALGSEHPQVALNLNNLAALYDSQGKYADAEPLYQRAIQIDEVALGPNHPGLATDLNNLAGLYQAQGKYADAEPLYQRAIRIDEVALGPNHPRLATDLNNLAGLYQAQGKYADAEPLYQGAYGIFKVRLGLEHPNTKTVLNNYVEFLLKNGDKGKIQVLIPDLKIVYPGIFAQNSSSKEPSR